MIKKNYLLLLLIIPLTIYILKPTYSKFTQSIITEEDVVTINTNLNININNIEEYKTFTVGSNDYDIFDIEINNNTDQKKYYTFWYKLIEPSKINDNITIAKLNNQENDTQGELEISEKKKVSIIIKNNTNKQIKVNIGVATNSDSIEEISLKEDRSKILKETSETNIYYDIYTNKYYLGETNTEYTFKTEAIIYNQDDNYQTFKAPYSGYYKIGLWGPSNGIYSGDQLTTNIYIKQNQTLYLYIGKNIGDDIYKETDIRIISGDWKSEQSLNSRILIAGNNLNKTYTYSDEFNEDTYNLNNNLKEKLKPLNNTLKIEKTNQGSGKVTIEYLANQEPLIEGIKYVKFGQNYKLEDIKCIDKGRGCKIIKVRPNKTDNLETGAYEINYIVKDNDNITYKYTSTFEVINE